MRARSRSAVLAVCLTALVAAGCGSDDSESDSGGAAEEKTLKVGLVTDIGGLNDRSFNQLANEGLKRSKSELGVEGRALTSDSNADYVPNLSSLAQQRYDLVIGVGFLMAESIDTVAQKFPKTNFAIIDADQATLKSKPANVRGLLFKEQQAGYLAGYLAGLYLKEEGGSSPTVGSVGGQKIPPVDHYIAGYQAGAEAANPQVETLNGYSQDFVDQAKCKELALNQIAEGAKVVFQVAGQCGLGVIDAAKEKQVEAIGVDADQSYLGSQVLTSAVKKVDVAVFNTVKAVQDGTFKGGGNETFELSNNGVGIGKISSAGSAFDSQVTDVADRIKSGEIKDIPDTVGGK